MYQLLSRIERGQGHAKDIDLLYEVAGSMGALPSGQGSTICGLADGANWAIRTIVDKFRNEFETRVKKKPQILQSVESVNDG